jgi:hypothetical protein
MSTPFAARIILPPLTLFATACYSQFWAGPQLANPPKTVKVEVAGCTTPKHLFDCGSQEGVAKLVQDYFTLNGIATDARPGEGGVLKVSLKEDTNVVSIDFELMVKAGQVWRAQAQGGDVLVALVRFEQLAQERLGMKVKYATSDNLAEPMKKVGRTRMVLVRTPGSVALEYK